LTILANNECINNVGTIAAVRHGGFSWRLRLLVVSLFEYLVLDKVRVVVKHIDYAQYIWESVAGGSLTVKKDTKTVHGEVSGYKVSGVSDCFFALGVCREECWTKDTPLHKCMHGTKFGAVFTCHACLTS